MINMFKLDSFTERETTFFVESLEDLLNRQIITGVNIFHEIINADVCIPLSYIHHSPSHEDQLKTLLLKKNILKSLAQNYKKRKKNSLYMWGLDWEIKKEEKEMGIEFYILKTKEKFDPSIIAKIRFLNEIYNGEDLIVAKDKGYDLNFNLKSKNQLLSLLKLFGKYCYKFVVDKKGINKKDEHNNDVLNPNKIIESYSVPVIIFKNNLDLNKKAICGFRPLHKISFIRGNEEISFYVASSYNALTESASYQTIKKLFNNEHDESVVFGNNTFVNYLDNAFPFNNLKLL